MFIVRKKEDKNIIYVSQPDIERHIEPKLMYEEFDGTVMECGWTDGTTIPEYFDVIDGEIKEKPLAELVDLGIMSISPFEKIVDNKIVLKSECELIEEGAVRIEEGKKLENGKVVGKSLEEQVEDGDLVLEFPYEMIVDNKIVQRSLADIADNGLISDLDSAVEFNRRVIKKIDKEIKNQYSPALEMKITKAYTLWLADGKPVGDCRAQRFSEMENKISEIKTSFRSLRDSAKYFIEKYSK